MSIRTPVSRDIRAALLSSLFGTLPIFFGGVINTLAVALVLCIRHPTAPFKFWLTAEALLCVVRLCVLFHALRAARAGRRTYTDVYLTLGVMWSAGVGYGCYISIMSGDWVTATLACLSAAAMICGIGFRNFGAPRLVSVMILCSIGPCALAAIQSGEPVLLLMAAQIPIYILVMTASAFRLNAMLVQTMHSERENDHRARHDELTGLMNRGGLMREIEEGVHHSDEFTEPLTLFYLDLDGFKPVNDTYGHEAGDNILRAVAHRLRMVARPGEIVARIGGDEFVLLSRRIAVEDRMLRAEDLIARISQGDYIVGSARVRIGVSIGIATLGEDGDITSLMHAADEALYMAKNERGQARLHRPGRNRRHGLAA